MYCVIIAVIFIVDSMQAVQLPTKTLTHEELRISDYVAQNWFRAMLQARKEELTEQVGTLLPRVFVPIIQEYEHPYTDIWQTVHVVNLVGLKKVNCGLEALLVDVPLRYKVNDQGEHVGFKLRYKDIFRACGGLLNRSLSINGWCADIKAQVAKGFFKKFLSNALVRKLTQPLHDNVMAHVPTLDHWPFAIYWNHEQTVLPRINCKTGERSKRRVRSDMIDESCYDMLQFHNKLPRRASKENLVIVCTTCKGGIERPSAPLSSLLLKHQSSNGARYCTGDHPRCRTYRALRCF